MVRSLYQWRQAQRQHPSCVRRRMFTHPRASTSLGERTSTEGGTKNPQPSRDALRRDQCQPATSSMNDPSTLAQKGGRALGARRCSTRRGVGPVLWGRLGSNQRPRDYESPALTTELLPRGWSCFRRAMAARAQEAKGTGFRRIQVDRGITQIGPHNWDVQSRIGRDPLTQDLRPKSRWLPAFGTGASVEDHGNMLGDFYGQLRNCGTT